MPGTHDDARRRFVRREPIAEIARALRVEEREVSRWARDGDWDALRDAVALELAALRTVEAEAADDRYAAVADAIRGLASSLAAKVRTAGTGDAAELLALTRAIKESLAIRETVERRRADRRFGRE